MNILDGIKYLNMHNYHIKSMFIELGIQCYTADELKFKWKNYNRLKVISQNCFLIPVPGVLYAAETRTATDWFSISLPGTFLNFIKIYLEPTLGSYQFWVYRYRAQSLPKLGSPISLLYLRNQMVESESTIDMLICWSVNHIHTLFIFADNFIAISYPFFFPPISSFLFKYEDYSSNWNLSFLRYRHMMSVAFFC